MPYRTSFYYTDKEWLNKLKIVAALRKRSLNGLLKDLASDAIAKHASKSINELQPNLHNPPGIFEERGDQKRKFMKMQKEELERYSKVLETHVELFRKAKSNYDPLW